MFVKISLILLCFILIKTSLSVFHNTQFLKCSNKCHTYENILEKIPHQNHAQTSYK